MDLEKQLDNQAKTIKSYREENQKLRRTLDNLLGAVEPFVRIPQPGFARNKDGFHLQFGGQTSLLTVGDGRNLAAAVERAQKVLKP